MKETLSEDSSVQVSATELSGIYESLIHKSKRDETRIFALIHIYIIVKKEIKILPKQNIPSANFWYSVFTKSGKILTKNKTSSNTNCIAKHGIYHKPSISQDYSTLQNKLPLLKNYSYKEVFPSNKFSKGELYGAANCENRLKLIDSGDYFRFRAPIDKSDKYRKARFFADNYKSVSM
eukprot:TRINITY_DN5406_c0_g1_i10.p1 TRINITY_DN5406_c0_g1~~TRINITY_DN5406_c0_g1_i10.p1  ORF type:complete len:178 (-),score=11.16 TRINITY_DN5406_c0_g1_i10:820-1353(-)